KVQQARRPTKRLAMNQIHARSILGSAKSGVTQSPVRCPPASVRGGFVTIRQARWRSLSVLQRERSGKLSRLRNEWVTGYFTTSFTVLDQSSAVSASAGSTRVSLKPSC